MKSIAISVTNYKDYPSLNYASFCYMDGAITILHTLTYEEGMRELKKYETILNKTADVEVNEYNNTIIYTNLHGLL